MKKISGLIMIIGIVIIGYALFQIYDANKKQNDSLAKAEALLDKGQTSKIDFNKNEPIQMNNSFELGEELGILRIDKIDATLPIVEGTDNEELKHGVGHYVGTAFPMESDQIVLSAHNDTAFKRTGELDLGDRLTVSMSYGDFEYEIVETFITDANDLTVIQSTAPDEILTLTTCYPFNFIGYTPERYIIHAKPVYKNNDE